MPQRFDADAGQFIACGIKIIGNFGIEFLMQAPPVDHRFVGMAEETNTFTKNAKVLHGNTGGHNILRNRLAWAGMGQQDVIVFRRAHRLIRQFGQVGHVFLFERIARP